MSAATELAHPPFAHPRTRELAEFLAERRADLRAAVVEHLAVLEGRVAALLGPAVEEARALGTTESEASSVRPRLDAERIRDRSRAIEAAFRASPAGAPT